MQSLFWTDLLPIYLNYYHIHILYSTFKQIYYNCLSYLHLPNIYGIQKTANDNYKWQLHEFTTIFARTM